MNSTSRLLLILTLLLGVLMGALDISIVGPAIPPIASSFTLAENDLAWIFSIYVLFNLICINPFTKLSDRYGRRAAYISAILLFAAGSAICAISTNYNTLLTGRAIQGVGSAGIFPVASAIIGDIIEPSRRGRFLGLLGSMFGLAFIVGPILAGVMLKALSWHYLFIINLPISALLLVASTIFIPNIKIADTNNSKLDIGGIALLGGALALITFAMSILGTNAIISILLLTISLIGLYYWYWYEKRQPYASFNVGLLQNRQIRNALTISVGAGVFQAAFVFFPKFLVGTFEVTSANAGFMLLPLVLATAVGAPLSGRLIDKAGSKVVVAIALPMVAAGFTILAAGSSTLTFYFGSIFIGFGLSMLVGSSLRYIVLNETNSTDRASAQGVIAIAISGGQIIGSAVIAFAVEKIGSYHPVFAAVAVLAALLTMAAFRLKSHISELHTTK